MAKFRKKPVVIDAWHFTKNNYKNGVPVTFQDPTVSLWSQYGGSVIGGEIDTLAGKRYAVSENDWIIKGVDGGFYPIKHDIFIAKYEPVFFPD